MKTRLTPFYITLVYDACLKSFWRKKALSQFLRQCSVSDTFISGWGSEETKRDFLDRLFVQLPKSDQGRSGLVRMAGFLMDQEAFPDLQNWEDSATKIKDAHDAVSRLHVYHSKQQDELELSRELGTQEAGYKFQDWFYDLLAFSEIPSRKPYVHNGRQIDGSLMVSGTTYLVELKFTRNQADANDIDTFYKKVTTKADNTMGIMLSISGYSSVARQEASGERTPILLLDHSHTYLVLGGIMGLADVIDRVRRHASQTGEAYLSAAEFSG